MTQIKTLKATKDTNTSTSSVHEFVSWFEFILMNCEIATPARLSHSGGDEHWLTQIKTLKGTKDTNNTNEFAWFELILMDTRLATTCPDTSGDDTD